MAYQTGTSTGPNDLLDKLRIFLASLGYSTNQWASDGTGYRLHMEYTPVSGEPTLYWNFRSAINEVGSTITDDNQITNDYGKISAGILINGSTGYNSGNDWHNQPGRPNSPGTSDSTASVMTGMSTSSIPAYYFFTVGDSIHIAVEVISGHFEFMSFGILNKMGAGAYDGGQYFTASFSSQQTRIEHESANYVDQYFSSTTAGNHHGFVYVDADGTESWRCSDGDDTPEIIWPVTSCGRSNAYYSEKGMASFFLSKGPNFYNNLGAGCPMYTLLKRSDDNYSLLGHAEGVRFLNFSLYSAAQEVVYGSDTWKLFPNLPLDDNDEQGNLNGGFAFLKVT